MRRPRGLTSPSCSLQSEAARTGTGRPKKSALLAVNVEPCAAGGRLTRLRLVLCLLMHATIRHSVYIYFSEAPLYPPHPKPDLDKK